MNLKRLVHTLGKTCRIRKKRRLGNQVLSQYQRAESLHGANVLRHFQLRL